MIIGFRVVQWKFYHCMQILNVFCRTIHDESSLSVWIGYRWFEVDHDRFRLRVVYLTRKRVYKNNNALSWRGVERTIWHETDETLDFEWLSQPVNVELFKCHPSIRADSSADWQTREPGPVVDILAPIQTWPIMFGFWWCNHKVGLSSWWSMMTAWNWARPKGQQHWKPIKDVGDGVGSGGRRQAG